MPSTPESPPGTEHMALELASQPEAWRRAAGMVAEQRLLPAAGQRASPSWAAERRGSWHSPMRGSERRAGRAGPTPSRRPRPSSTATTTRSSRSPAPARRPRCSSSLDANARTGPTIGIVGDAASPARRRRRRGHRAALRRRAVRRADPLRDDDARPAARVARRRPRRRRSPTRRTRSTTELDPALVDAEQYAFLGRGWTVGLAHEAALKMREAAQSWTESYPAMEYRHGPIAIAAPGRVTWMLGEAPDGTRAPTSRRPAPDSSRATGIRWPSSCASRASPSRGRVAAGLDPDEPRNLTRSVILG